MNRKSVWVAALSIAGLALAGCATEPPDPEVEAALARNEMPRAARELNCVACHALDHRVVGPAWMDVAKRYRGATWFVYNNQGYPLVEGLVMKVSLGGSGHWGSMPMPANDPGGAKRDKIEHLVRFILKLDRAAGAHPRADHFRPEPPPNIDPAPASQG
jgi:cytochrome c